MAIGKIVAFYTYMALFTQSLLTGAFLYFNVATLNYIRDILAAHAKRKYTTITIPTALFDNIERLIGKTGFSSVSDYATYVLRETVAELEMEKRGGAKQNSTVMEKLRALGYLGD